MGIQLDWQIESERQERRAGEDPAVRRQRRVRRRNLLMLIVGVVVVLGGVVGAVLWRLNAVEDRLRQDLLDTVDAEIRALKVGNEANYMAIRRSGSPAWIGYQQETFADYQRLKADGSLEITGRVLDVEMDIEQSRARVTVEEILNGEPHAVVWFYWYYSDDDRDGWRRVPPDVEFWGEQHVENIGRVRVIYFELDAALGDQLARDVPQWWQTGCELVNCADTLPQLVVEVDPRWSAGPSWSAEDRWTLRISSPFNDQRASQTNLLSPDLQESIIALLAARIVEHYSPAGANLDAMLAEVQTESFLDGQWLASEFRRWLENNMPRTEIDSATQLTFLDSITPLYGDQAAPLMLRMLSTNMTLGPVFTAASGTAINALPVEILNTIYWRDYFEYRLLFEAALLRDDFGINDPLQTQLRHDALYVSTRDGLAAAQSVRQRFLPSQPEPLIQSVNLSIGLDGRPIATLMVIYARDVGPQRIDFQWDTDLCTWKRLNS